MAAFDNNRIPFVSSTINREFIEIHGSVLRGNKNMLALEKKLGFDISRDPDTGENRLVIHLEGKKQ